MKIGISYHGICANFEEHRSIHIDTPDSLSVDDVVLCKVGGRQYLHLIKAIDGNRFLIGNNRGGVNGWIGYNSIYGKADV